MSKLPKIPGYILMRKLGHGGMADVFLGIQENLQREVAVKVLEASLFRDEQFSERFKNEALTAAKLSHPNIITIHDIGQIEDTYYIVMEYLPESLKDRIQKLGIIPPKEALDIIRMVASALDYAHNKGFIHRDIKPDNIMFRADGTAVLVDFGIARAMDSSSHLTRTGTSIGTPYYMSPEQCRGENIDGRSDIYALGVQLYQLLTGKLPYKAENTTGIILKHIQDPVPRLPKELNQYQLLLDKMMAKDKETRISGGAELIKFIDAFLTAQDQQLIPTPDLPTSPVTMLEVPLTEKLNTPPPQSVATFSISKQPGRKKWLLPSLTALAIIVAIGTGIHLLSPSQQVKDENKNVSEKEVSTNDLQNKTTQSVGNKKSFESFSVNEVKPGKTDKAEETDPGLTTQKKPVKISPKVELTSKIKSNEMPATSTMKMETFSDLHPDIRNEYNAIMDQLNIPTAYPKLKVMGQIAVSLAVDENGKIKIQNFQDMILVTPVLHERLVKLNIGKKIKNMILPPPKNKKGEPINITNWRVIYKIRKSLSGIVLARQNKDD